MTTPQTPIERLAARIAAAEAKRRQATLCSSGGTHAWAYQRVSPGVGTYTCVKCAYQISKADLKAATDKDTLTVEV